MSAWTARRLRLIHYWDRLCFAGFRWRHGSALAADADVSPNLRFARLRIEPGGGVEIGGGFATERQAGNHIFVQRSGSLQLGRDVWLRTEVEPNRITVFPAARIEIADGSLINGAMLHAKSEISIGCEARIGFGVRVLDADLHDLDADTPERIEPVRIGDRVWIGANALVLRGVRIGDDCVIAAGSVVIDDVPDRSLAAGAPAKPVRRLGSREGCG